MGFVLFYKPYKSDCCTYTPWYLRWHYLSPSISNCIAFQNARIRVHSAQVPRGTDGTGQIIFILFWYNIIRHKTLRRAAEYVQITSSRSNASLGNQNAWVSSGASGEIKIMYISYIYGMCRTKAFFIKSRLTPKNWLVWCWTHTALHRTCQTVTVNNMECSRFLISTGGTNPRYQLCHRLNTTINPSILPFQIQSIGKGDTYHPAKWIGDWVRLAS